MPAEEWVPLREFPNYEVSDGGRIQNANTFRIMTPTPNQKGIPNVILAKENRYYRRAVAPLVAHTFLPPHQHYAYDTPINLDGNRFNNRVRNLAWRPLWFARRYHAQFKEPWRRNGPIMIVETGEYFEYTEELIIKYGLLETQVLNAARNHDAVLILNKHLELK